MYSSSSNFRKEIRKGGKQKKKRKEGRRKGGQEGKKKRNKESKRIKGNPRNFLSLFSGSKAAF